MKARRRFWNRKAVNKIPKHNSKHDKPAMARYEQEGRREKNKVRKLAKIARSLAKAKAKKLA